MKVVKVTRYVDIRNLFIRESSIMFRGKNQMRWFIVMLAIFCCSLMTIVFVNYLDFNTKTEIDKFGVQGRVFINSNDLNEAHHRIKRLPQAIIIGSRKSGTRALLKFLELNPSIKAAHNEVHFFDDEQNYSKGLDWYRSQMPSTKADEIAIEKSPAYFVTKGVAERIRDMNSSIKLILIMRHPVTRLISDFSQIFANRLDKSARGMLENQTDNDYLGQVHSAENYSNNYWTEASKEFKDYVLRPDGGIAEQRRAIRIGMYSIYIEKWLATFRREQFHFVDGEQLISNPYQVIHEVEKFLNLKPLIKAEQFVYNPKKGFYCITSNITHGEEETNHQHGRQATQSKWIISPANSLSSGGEKSEKLVCLSKSKGRRHVNVTNELLSQLDEFYSPYNEYLYSITGINFNTNHGQTR